ncbi:MAG: CehA/McbA family metallohydrolase [Actinomycetota bacterium]|nr:CehA/McbA family metallohydrolase [Actinomycetota bacterium]
MRDLACAIHLHSTYSDGTGTVPEIVRAARRAGVDVVVLTDHDTLAGRVHEGWYDDVLLLVGVEVSPRGENHYLAFGLEEPIDHRGMAPAEICRAVADAGGFGFAAHPFSGGSALFDRPGMPFRDLDCEALAGVELWSFVTDVGESVGSWREALRFIVAPGRVMRHPPERNLREWDRMNRARRVVGIGGIDAHQFGKRVLGRWVVRPMGYARSFRQLRTHVWLDELPTGDLEHDRAQVFAALRDGRCYIAADALAPARGFTWDGSRVSLPRPAEIRFVRDGEVVHTVHAASAEHDADRVEVRLGGRTWILSNYAMR